MPAARPALAAALVAAAAWGACRPGPGAGPPPNVLLLVVDCLRADRLSAHGYHRPTTPNLDALAAEGVSFTRAFAQASWTRPSLPTLLTGLYPSEHALQEFSRGRDGAVMSPRLADEVTTLPEALKARGYATALVGEQAQLSRRFGLDQGFDHYRSHVGSAANIHELFWRWQRRPETASPFFAYLHYLELHWPYCPPAAVRGTFDAGRSALPPCRGWREQREQMERGEIVPTRDDVEAMAARYDEELLALDRELGRLFADLRAAGLWDDTLIVLTADHGEQFWEHGAGGHGVALWDELLAVPLIFKPPAAWRSPRGAQVDHLVENRDLFPTVLAAAGAPPVAAVSAPSLLPWLLPGAPAAAPHPFVVAESQTQVAVRTRDFKLIADRDGGGLDLYALAEDPGETRDVAGERRRELAELRGHLAAWRTGLAAAAPAAAEALDPETEKRLKALGYLGD
jgi:arylsulfatase A-like enzyme